MNGGELAKAIRALRPTLPVLLTTGYFDGTDASDDRFQILQKPYGTKQLSDALRAALSPF